MKLSPNMIQQIQIRTQKRMQAKQELDSYVTLAASSNKDDKTITLSASGDKGTYRLLDEGFVVDTEGYPLFYIMKNTIQNFFDKLSTDYVGSINIGHMSFASFPFLVGDWSKQALNVIDIGDGRKGLDVTPNLNDESLFIKELKTAGYPIGISAEFSYKLDLEATEEYGIDMVNEIDIAHFALVGEAGNVGSSNINLKGSGKMSKKKEKENIFERFFKKYGDENKNLNAEGGEGTNPPEPETDPINPTDPEDPEGKDGEEDDPEDNPELDSKLEEAAQIMEKQEETITSLQKEQTKALALMEKMENHIQALEAENKKLKGNNEQLSASAETGLSHFEEVVKKLNLTTESIIQPKEKDKEQKEKAVITDGFGEV